ncbi:hypothetical protein [Pseudomarimonas arenosa]|uniref:Uncharacterized protein n=1 Tax=Pseudomarimonas arenosa TaxID=2774145 RepID=A0AAW3ZPE2_9GAMM|nr:hypothetical protein [Pseudomarimonas arenosa]MBD8528048.1 hypothetical protein [Pseudomarimonas arenosa]
MNDKDIKAQFTQFSDTLLVGLLAIAFALADGFAQFLLGLAFLATFAALIVSGGRKAREGDKAPPEAP